jgi:sugar porter (SP) family MFS transporter
MLMYCTDYLPGGVLTFDSFHHDFRYGPSRITTVSAISVGIQQVGALVGCFAIWPINNGYGRRVAIMVCSLIFCLGVVLEVINSHSLRVFYLGRLICGLGVGGSSTTVPIYLSEMAPKEMRAQLGSCYQLMFTVGILVSYWIDYAVNKLVPSDRSAQWQIPVTLQLVPGGLMGLGVLTLEESVRWLVSKEQFEKARHSLEWIRASGDQMVADELSEIRAGIEDERQAQEGFSMRELLDGPNAHRILLAIGIFLAQQSTGATALAYFGPQFFSMVVGSGDPNLTLLLTGIFGLIKVTSCAAFIVFISDRFGRRTLLLAGAAFMAVCMLITSAIVKSSGNSSTISPTAMVAATTLTPSNILTIGLIYANIIAFNLSWGPLPWPYTSEIFPTRIREPGVAFGVGSQWLFNLIWSSATPYLIVAIGWATFLLFGILDILIIVFVGCCLKETARKTLEEINEMFVDDNGHDHQLLQQEGEGEEEEEEQEQERQQGYHPVYDTDGDDDK